MPSYPDRHFMSDFPSWMMYQDLDRDLTFSNKETERPVLNLEEATAILSTLPSSRKTSLASLFEPEPDLTFSDLGYDEFMVDKLSVLNELNCRLQALASDATTQSISLSPIPEPISTQSISQTWTWNIPSTHDGLNLTLQDNEPTMPSVPQCMEVEPTILLTPQSRHRDDSPLSTPFSFSLPQGRSVSSIKPLSFGTPYPDSEATSESDMDRDEYSSAGSTCGKRRKNCSVSLPPSPGYLPQPHKRSKREYPCLIYSCQHRSNTPHELFKHRETHFPGRFQCPGCQQLYVRSSSLSRHLMRDSSKKCHAVAGPKSSWGVNLTRFELHPPVWQQPGWLEQNQSRS